ncbi:hypothetical protein ACQPZ2_30035 [Nocardia pseudovaccinii]
MRPGGGSGVPIGGVPGARPANVVVPRPGVAGRDAVVAATD